MADGSHNAIGFDAAFQRVAALPRRADCTDELTLASSEFFRLRPFDDDGQPNILWPAQATALRELWYLRGLFAPMPVGSGKTLITLLAPTMLNSARPVLVIPASLRDKTRRDFARYRKDWRVRLPVLVSYEELGRTDREQLLFELVPDLLMCDEAHKIRNLDSAVTRRIKRYIDAARPVSLVLSGTLMTPQLMDYHHLTVWSLNDFAPVPLRASEAERWAQAIDRNVGILRRLDAGALQTLPGGFHEWFRGSAGVVSAPGSDCTASIQLSNWCPKLPYQLERVIDEVAETRIRPDGEELDEWDLPDVLCQLCQGFYYVWDPMPPAWWLLPRKAWRIYVRAVLDEHLPGFDSEAQVALALDRPHLHQPPAAQEGARLLAEWRAVRDRFEPNPVPVWLDVSPLAQAADYVVKHKAIAWVRHIHAGIMLSKLGIPYYGGESDPETAPPGEPIAASIQAHGAGKNLQAWNHGLVLTPMANASAWEQLIGRFHRAGQRSDTVSFRVIAAIEYHHNVMARVLAEAKATAIASGFTQKLVAADWAA